MPKARSAAQIWMEQCAAAEAILDKFGLERALTYLIGEKLFSFIYYSERFPEFAAELPDFAAQVRRIFKPEDIRHYLDDLRRTKYRRRWVSDAELERFWTIRKLLKS